MFSGSSKDIDVRKLVVSVYEKSRQSFDVRMSVNESIIPDYTEEITLIVSNQSDMEYIYGKKMILETEFDSKWYSLPMLENVAWTLEGYSLLPSESREITFSIKDYYGKLTLGKYRIVKELTLLSSDELIFIIAEFEIHER